MRDVQPISFRRLAKGFWPRCWVEEREERVKKEKRERSVNVAALPDYKDDDGAIAATMEFYDLWVRPGRHELKGLWQVARGLRHSSWLLAPFFSAESGATEIVALFVWQVWCVQVQVSVPGHLINEFYSFPMTKHWQELSPELWAMQGCEDSRMRRWHLWLLPQSVRSQQIDVTTVVGPTTTNVHQITSVTPPQNAATTTTNAIKIPQSFEHCPHSQLERCVWVSLVWFATKKALINLCMQELYCT